MPLSAPPAPFAPVSGANSAAALDVVRQRRSQTARPALDPMVPIDEVSISEMARRRQDGSDGARKGIAAEERAVGAAPRDDASGRSDAGESG